MATTLSAFPPPGTTSQTIRLKPIAPRQCASFTIDRSNSITSRRHSWTSSYDILTPSGMLEDILEDSSHEEVGAKRAAAVHLSRPGATFDMAYFLRNTGPPPQRESASRDRKVVGKKRSLVMFGKKKDGDVALSNSSSRSTLINFIPPERVEQKVTLMGKKYLQIIPSLPDYNVLDSTNAKRHNVSQFSNAQKLSVSISDRTDSIGTEALDSWISTFTIQHKEADLSIKPQTDRDLKLNSSSDPPEKSYSFKATSRSCLPSLDSSGFGLSIIDGPAISETCLGALDIHAPLSSNPPTVPPSPLLRSSHVRIKTPEQELNSMGIQPSAVSSFEEHGVEKKTENGVSVDRLAGQGLRRPFKEHDRYDTNGSDVRNSTSQVPRPQDSAPEVTGCRHSIASAIQSRRNREVVVRARKIKELQRACRYIDALPKEESCDEQIALSIDDSGNETINFPTPPDSAQYATGARSSLDYKTGYTSFTATGNVRISPVMLIAEQIPIQRDKQVKKPSRLILRERTSMPIAIAVRTSDNESYSQANSPLSYPPQESASVVQTEAEAEAAKKVEQSPVTAATGQKIATTTPPGVPPKSVARAASAASNYRHLSTPLLTTPLPNIGAPQAVKATTTSDRRTSVCSSHTSASKEARLEARLDALERENRLLEAALLAVLKTSGTLNRCPCVLLSRRQDDDGLRSKRESGQILHSNGKEGIADGRVVVEEEERRGSVESNISGFSALDVYLETRLV